MCIVRKTISYCPYCRSQFPPSHKTKRIYPTSFTNEIIHCQHFQNEQTALHALFRKKQDDIVKKTEALIAEKLKQQEERTQAAKTAKSAAREARKSSGVSSSNEKISTEPASDEQRLMKGKSKPTSVIKTRESAKATTTTIPKTNKNIPHVSKVLKDIEEEKARVRAKNAHPLRVHLQPPRFKVVKRGGPHVMETELVRAERICDAHVRAFAGEDMDADVVEGDQVMKKKGRGEEKGRKAWEDVMAMEREDKFALRLWLGEKENVQPGELGKDALDEEWEEESEDDDPVVKLGRKTF